MNDTRLNVLIGKKSSTGILGIVRTREFECGAESHLARLVAGSAVGNGWICSDLRRCGIRNIYSLRGHDDEFVRAIRQRSGVNFLVGFEGLRGRSKKIS